jgi:predicted HAD superfamily Cof-like phosphohydrolase
MSKASNPLLNMSTDHYERVHRIMDAFGQTVHTAPTIPDQKTRILRARLIMEEALETIEALGIGITITGLADSYSDGASVEFSGLEFHACKEPDLAKIADGTADLSVVNVGTMIACGLPDRPLLEAADKDNLAKIGGPIDEHGKFQRPAGYVSTDWEELVAAIDDDAVSSYPKKAVTSEELKAAADTPEVKASVNPYGRGGRFA